MLTRNSSKQEGKMSRTKLRPVDPYNAETDGATLYRFSQLATLIAIGGVVWFIHTYVGWWNLFIGLTVLFGFSLLAAVKFYPYFPELRFTSLDDRPHGGEVYAYEYSLNEDEIDEVERILGQSPAPTKAADPTDKAEATLWRLLFLSVPGFMFFGWLQPGSTVSLVQVIVSAILALLALWWWSRLLNHEE